MLFSQSTFSINWIWQSCGLALVLVRILKWFQLILLFNNLALILQSPFYIHSQIVIQWLEWGNLEYGKSFNLFYPHFTNITTSLMNDPAKLTIDFLEMKPPGQFTVLMYIKKCASIRQGDWCSHTNWNPWKQSGPQNMPCSSRTRNMLYLLLHLFGSGHWWRHLTFMTQDYGDGSGTVEWMYGCLTGLTS